MRCSSDKFDSPLVRLFVSLRACKRRKKRVVDVDSRWCERYEFGGEDLHVACKDDQVDSFFLHQRQLYMFLRAPIFCVYRDTHKSDFLAFHKRPTLFVITNYECYLTRQLAIMDFPYQVSETMVGLADEYGHALFLIGEIKVPHCSNRLGNRLKLCVYICLRNRKALKCPFKTRKKEPVSAIQMLVGV